MITFSEHLIVTKELNEVVCRYAQKIIIKDFLTKFSFPDCSKNKDEYDTDDINSQLETLSLHQGDFHPETESFTVDFIYEFIEQLDESDKVALYYLVIDSNYFAYYDDFINNEGEDIEDEKLIDKAFGRFLASKIYAPIDSDFQDDVEEFLKNKIQSFSDDIDLSLIDDSSITHIFEIIENYTEKISIL